MVIDLQPTLRTEGDQAEFNSGIAYLEKLIKLEYIIEGAFMNWMLRDVFVALESYENELAYCFKEGKNKEEGEQEKINKMKEKINKIFSENPMMGSKGRNGLIGKEKYGEVKTKLVELNKYLRKIKALRGLGMPIKGEGKLF